MAKTSYRLTILNVVSYLSIVGIIFYTLIYYKSLSASGGWGVVSMVGLGLLCVGGLIVDAIIQLATINIKRNRMSLVNYIGSGVLFLFIVFIMIKGF
jgi:hypothetical protein